MDSSLLTKDPVSVCIAIRCAPSKCRQPKETKLNVEKLGLTVIRPGSLQLEPKEMLHVCLQNINYQSSEELKFEKHRLTVDNIQIDDYLRTDFATVLALGSMHKDRVPKPPLLTVDIAKEWVPGSRFIIDKLSINFASMLLQVDSRLFHDLAYFEQKLEEEMQRAKTLGASLQSELQVRNLEEYQKFVPQLTSEFELMCKTMSIEELNLVISTSLTNKPENQVKKRTGTFAEISTSLSELGIYGSLATVRRLKLDFKGFEEKKSNMARMSEFTPALSVHYASLSHSLINAALITKAKAVKNTFLELLDLKESDQDLLTYPTRAPRALLPGEKLEPNALNARLTNPVIYQQE